MKLLSSLAFVLLAITEIAGADPVEIKVGASLPLTGGLAFTGEDIRKGMTLAFEQVTPTGVKFVPIFDDNQHQAKLAASSAQRLLEIEKVNVIISLWDMADVIAPLAERKGIPHISIRWDPGVAEQYSNTMTVESTYRSYIDSLLKLLLQLNARTVSLMTEEGKGWILASDYLHKVASQSGISILADQRFVAGTSDFQTLVLKATKSDPDYVLLFSNPPHTEQLVGTLRKVAPKQKFTGYFEVLEDPKLVNGIPFVAQFEVAEWFGQMYQKRFNAWPKGRAPQAFDIVKILAATVERTKQKPTSISIAETVRNFSKNGAAGPLFVTGARTIESKCIWKIANNGKFEVYSGLSNGATRDETSAADLANSP